MRIGIDARLYGLEHTGLGRYVMKLIETVLKADTKNQYVLFLTTKYAAEFKNKKRVKVVVADIPIYSFAEQIILPFVFAKEKLDLLHIPHFNAPLFYPGKFTLTIHDLIKHDSKGKETTTHHSWLYAIKRLGYLFLTNTIIRRASAVIVPSEYVKRNIVTRLSIPTDKVTVTYEAVSGSFKDVVLTPKEKHHLLEKYGLIQPFVVYTGNIYPHKNVNILVEAIARHNQNREVDLQLALICSRSVFWDRLNKQVSNKGLQDWVKMLGFVDDNDVSGLYSLALALVHPSKMEGFGLTGLEAMGVGLPVISSNASCLPEVYGDAALYFDPDDVDDIVSCLETIIQDQELRKTLAAKGYLQSRKYSWEKMGKETVAVYKKILNPSSLRGTK